MSTRSRQRGFSLLEVVVAFAIAVLALGILSQIFGQGSRRLALAGDYAHALGVAENLMAEYGAPVSGESVTISDSEESCHWNVQILPYPVPMTPGDDGAAGPLTNNAFELVKIEISVDWTRDGKSRAVSLESLRMVVSDPDARTTRQLL